ncbi:DUF2092 domain-containing protein [Hyphomicrobium sp.]|uniref:DUF2092 domain-containing protein n=1 Tax=Hyphomicrobium sp. TaxID=82 RepID=UPI000FBF0287|nr:DUF2092 domain-containing protein [Hyphomicrobium sp.]RUP09904.1 MAG: DUF2092 domain-containing protein [Hyphomicrobium sp.]
MSFRALFYILFCLIAVPASAQESAKSPANTEGASALPTALKELREFIDAQQDMDFQTTFHGTSNVLDTTTQGTGQFTTRRPNLFRIKASSGANAYEYISDGTILTIYNVHTNAYAQTAARPSVIGNMTLIAGLMSFQARIFDFFAALDQAAAGGGGVKITAKGTESVGGRECDRFDVVTMTEKWESWVEKAAPHLPCKLASSDVDDPSAMVQVNEFTWKKAPSIDTATFQFSPPHGSKQLDIGTLLATPQ